MEWLVLIAVLAWGWQKVFGESERDKRWREWKEQNPNYIDVLRSD